MDRWASVDSSVDPDAFVRFLDRASTRAGEAPATLALLDLQAGKRRLDVGCGVGEDARAMAASGAAVCGVDVSRHMVDEATSQSTGHARPAFLVGDARGLPFADGVFHAAWTKRTLIHLADAGCAMEEMARVVEPGGRVVAVEADSEPLLVDSALVDVTRRLQAFAASSFANPWAGRQLRRLMLEAGLADVQVAARVMAVTDLSEAGLGRLVRLAVERGVVGADEAAAWQADLRSRQERGVFACYRLSFVAAGRVPRRRG